MSVKSFVAILLFVPCIPAPPGKSTIAASDAMHSLAFNLKYLPVTVAEDNGAGNMMGGTLQGRVQVLQNNSYTERNCQLFSVEGTLKSAGNYYSMTPNGLGKDCTYSGEGKQYTAGTELHKVFAYNKGQCCNACVATDGCMAASFLTSSNDHSGGQGPQTWEGFGIHISEVTTAKTTGGITVPELESHFRERFGDYSEFDQFMDYSVTFFTYDLQPYVDTFKQDSIPFFVGQWTSEQTKEIWYSLFFLANASHYVLELTSPRKPSVDSRAFPTLEQRMSDAHVKKFAAYGEHQAHVLEISSINRATSNVSMIHDVYTNLFQAVLMQEINKDGVVRRCYDTSGSSASIEFPPPPGPQMNLDEHVCFTERDVDREKDAVFSVLDFEQMLWAEHAGTIGNNANSMIDYYTENHYAQPMNSNGMSTLLAHFEKQDPYPITKDTRLAYACKQNYIIDPTGWTIQPIAHVGWPKCSVENTIIV
jgi:hypothetical protein